MSISPETARHGNEREDRDDGKFDAVRPVSRRACDLVVRRR